MDNIVLEFFLLFIVIASVVLGLYMLIFSGNKPEEEAVVTLTIGPSPTNEMFEQRMEALRRQSLEAAEARFVKEKAEYAEGYNKLSQIVIDFGREVNGEVNFYVKSGLLTFNLVTKRLTYRPDGSPEKVSLVDGKFETIEKLLKEIEGK